jgi:hypothetical protein
MGSLELQDCYVCAKGLYVHGYRFVKIFHSIVHIKR